MGDGVSPPGRDDLFDDPYEAETRLFDRDELVTEAMAWLKLSKPEAERRIDEEGHAHVERAVCEEAGYLRG